MLSCGGLTLTAIYSIVGAHWPGPYKRFAESFAAFIPVAFLLGLVSIAGGEYIFDWQANGAMHGKEGWLSKGRFYGTDLGLLLAMAIMSYLMLKASSRPNLRNLAENGEGFAKRMAESWTAGWKGDEEERVASKQATAKLAPLTARTSSTDTPGASSVSVALCSKLCATALAFAVLSKSLTERMRPWNLTFSFWSTYPPSTSGADSGYRMSPDCSRLSASRAPLT